MDITFHCVRSAVFLPRMYDWSTAYFSFTFTLAPVYFHGLVFAIFASLIAPFGGFFASGVKRAFRKKDFDSIFPGHGGVVDRMDCQMIMQLFVWIYLRTFVFQDVSVASIISVVALWPVDKKLELLNYLKNAIPVK
jgi:CDP-diglyceride synthetase